MAACSANLEKIIATHSRLGGAPVRDFERSLSVSGALIANGWMSWSSRHDANIREREVPQLHRPSFRRPLTTAGAANTAAAA